MAKHGLKCGRCGKTCHAVSFDLVDGDDSKTAICSDCMDAWGDRLIRVHDLEAKIRAKGPPELLTKFESLRARLGEDEDALRRIEAKLVDL